MKNLLTNIESFKQRYKELQDGTKKLNKEVDEFLVSVLQETTRRRIDFKMYRDYQDRYEACLTEGERAEVLLDALVSSGISIHYSYFAEHSGLGLVKSLALNGDALQIVLVDVETRDEYVLGIDDIDSYEALLDFVEQFN